MIGCERCQLDEHAGGARLVDVLLGEPDRRRPVRVAVELLVQRLGLGEQRRGCLPEPQLLEFPRADLVQVRGEHLAVGVTQRLPEHPSRI